jgi:FkbM family methyltransferase
MCSVSTRPEDHSTNSFFFATEQDIDYCYRLLLHRRPDPAGLALWRNLVRTQGLTLPQLTSAFLDSGEFRELREALREPQCVDLGEFKIYLRRDDCMVGAHIAAARCWEPHVAGELTPLLKPGSVFADVGANIGYFTLLAASRVGEEGSVIAFEPNPANCELLERSIQENRFHNVRLRPVAVAEREQILDLHTSNSSSLSLVVGADSCQEIPKGYQRYSIPADSLDHFLADIPRLDVVKIDTDGGEPRILEGMREIVRRHRPVIFTEFYPEGFRKISGRTPESFLDELKGLGYGLYILSCLTPKSRSPLSKTQILEAVTPAQPFLDLVAYPGSS